MKESEPITADTENKIGKVPDQTGVSGSSGSSGAKPSPGKWYDVYYKKRKR